MGGRGSASMSSGGGGGGKRAAEPVLVPFSHEDASKWGTEIGKMAREEITNYRMIDLVSKRGAQVLGDILDVIENTGGLVANGNAGRREVVNAAQATAAMSLVPEGTTLRFDDNQSGYVTRSYTKTDIGWDIETSYKNTASWSALNDTTSVRRVNSLEAYKDLDLAFKTVQAGDRGYDPHIKINGNNYQTRTIREAERAKQESSGRRRRY